MRGAVVEWLERLAVVRKVAGSSPARAKRLENSHCPPSSEWVPVSLQRRLKAAKGEDWAPPFTCRAQDTMGLKHPIAPTAIRLRAPLPPLPYLYYISVRSFFSFFLFFFFFLDAFI